MFDIVVGALTMFVGVMTGATIMQMKINSKKEGQ